MRRIDLMCYKIVFSLIVVKFNYFFPVENCCYTTRGHPFKLFNEYRNVNARKSFSVNTWLMCGTICHQILLILSYYGYLMYDVARYDGRVGVVNCERWVYGRSTAGGTSNKPRASVRRWDLLTTPSDDRLVVAKFSKSRVWGENKPTLIFEVTQISL